MAPVDPIACGAFLLAAFVLAGATQVVWLGSRQSRRFAVPLDAGLRFRGRRILGANKTARGFVVMVPAAAASFALLSRLPVPLTQGLWPLTSATYALLGAWAAIGFMAGELPNSFVKRQLDVAPGAAASGRLSAACQFLVDRLDSGVGMLAAVSLVVPTPWTTWAVVLLVGPAIHWSFSVVMFRLGIEPRPA
jgi:CDP-2,3-bis-(O-geranylgeranyl)-sn-glycerol synthase